jgi:hypothetical protein
METGSTLIEQLRSQKTLLSSEQLAPLLGIEVGTLAARRTRRQAPAFIKVGGLVRYDSVVVADWLESRTFKPTVVAPASIPTWLQPDRNKASITSGQ